MASNITFKELKNVALEVSYEELRIKHLLYNESFFSMINIDDDNDINGVFKASRTDSNEKLLFATRRKWEEDGIHHQCNHP